jgi:hypothetical protein
MGVHSKKVFNKGKSFQLARESFCKAHANPMRPQKKNRLL